MLNFNVVTVGRFLFLYIGRKSKVFEIMFCGREISFQQLILGYFFTNIQPDKTPNI